MARDTRGTPAGALLSAGSWLPGDGAASGPGRRFRDGIRQHGYAVCHGRTADWAAEPGRAAHELPDEDRARYRAAVDPEVRARILGSRRLLRHAVAAVDGTDPARVVTGRARYGRPVIREPAGIEVSISHTADLLVVAVARRHRIGVDAEAGDRRLLTPGLPEKICHPEELAVLRRLPSPVRARELVRVWTLKEAYAKALGVGLRLDFSQMCFRPERTGPDGRAWCLPGAPGWRFRSGTVAGRFLLAHAVGPAATGHTAAGGADAP